MPREKSSFLYIVQCNVVMIASVAYLCVLVYSSVPLASEKLDASVTMLEYYK